ncbi:hypothetical protein BDU57DRAFT_509193 [Ampelomyces quisqualis]|uniref:Uncharacterized protein n=1 Tax=Ampelomyces quisqualis TaxID=50730 RepID=A0A6A5R1A4_AMPQU|nr:hypothetical protein BDU57DRAFT_509193 [Ampelomyces quisqualis]
MFTCLFVCLYGPWESEKMIGKPCKHCSNCERLLCRSRRQKSHSTSSLARIARLRFSRGVGRDVCVCVCVCVLLQTGHVLFTST